MESLQCRFRHLRPSKRSMSQNGLGFRVQKCKAFLGTQLLADWECLLHVGGCQTYDPLLGNLKIRCRIITGIQKRTRTIILTTIHVALKSKSWRLPSPMNLKVGTSNPKPQNSPEPFKLSLNSNPKSPQTLHLKHPQPQTLNNLSPPKSCPTLRTANCWGGHA